ncbi:MAG: hypothetical protein ACREJG_02165, partial [Candidatus Rokuibacteriota bacterium]
MAELRTQLDELRETTDAASGVSGRLGEELREADARIAAVQAATKEMGEHLARTAARLEAAEASLRDTRLAMDGLR